MMIFFQVAIANNLGDGFKNRPWSKHSKAVEYAPAGKGEPSQTLGKVRKFFM
jgi:hypothetical protein